MGMGRKKKKAILKRVLLILASAVILAAVVTALHAWRRAMIDRQEMETASETNRIGTEGSAETQKGIPAGEGADETNPEKAGTEETETAKRETQSEDTEKPKDTEKPEDTEGTEKEEETKQKYAVTVLNKDEFAKQVMASRAYLLDKYLSSYVEKKQIKADEGIILDVAVALDDAYCTEFYVELNNKKKSLVTLRWNPYPCTVKASKCQYTRKEIENAVWADGDAAVRDISKEEDEALIGRQDEEQTDPAETETGTGEEVVLE